MLKAFLLSCIVQSFIYATPVDQCAPYLNSILTNNYIGGGAHGRVFEGNDPTFGEVAIKIAHQKHDITEEIEFTKEVNKFMKHSLSFNGFVQLYDVVPCGPFEYIDQKFVVLKEFDEHSKTLYMIMEKLDGLLRDELKEITHIKTFGSLMAQCFYIIENTYKNLGFVHEDLNPGNIMIKKEEPSEELYYTIQDQNSHHLYLPKAATHNSHVKFIDFGLSRLNAYQETKSYSRDILAIFDIFISYTPKKFFQNLKLNHEKEFWLLNSLYFRVFEHLDETYWKKFNIERKDFNLIWLNDNYFYLYMLKVLWNEGPLKYSHFLDHEFFHHLFSKKNYK